MLIKAINQQNDFEKTLKYRRLMALLFLFVGLVGFVCYFLLVPSSSLSEYAQGFYLGAATGITAGALVLLARTQYLLKNASAQKRAKIKETDERELHILRQSFLVAGAVTFFATAAALFVVLPLNQLAFFALFGTMVLYCLTFVAANLWLSKRL